MRIGRDRGRGSPLPRSGMAIGLGLALMLAVGCSEQGTGPEERDRDDIVTVEVTAESEVIELGASTQLTARVLTAAGHDVAGLVDIVWTMEPSGVITLDADNLATGVAVGTVEVSATSNELTGSITIEVENPGS